MRVGCGFCNKREEWREGGTLARVGCGDGKGRCIVDTTKTLIRTWWAALLASPLVLPMLAAQQAWADEGSLAAADGEPQAQKKLFVAKDVPGGGRLTVPDATALTAKTVKIPKTYGGKKVVEVSIGEGGDSNVELIDTSEAVYLRSL